MTTAGAVRRALPSLDLRGDPYVAELADQDRPPVADRDDGVAERVGVGGATDHAHEVLLVVGRHEPAGRVAAPGADRVRDLVEGDVEPSERLGAQHDLHLLDAAADRHDLGDPRDPEQALADDLIGHAAGFHRALGVVALPPERQEQDLPHHRGGRGHLGRSDVGRELRRRDLELLVDDLARARQVGAPRELDPHDRDADPRRRADPAHARRAVDRRLDRPRDQGLDLLRREAVRLGHDGDGRRGQVGEHVDRDPPRDDRPHDDEQHGRRDDQQAALHGPGDQRVQHRGLSAGGRGRGCRQRR
jgi:hypothetical protein